MTTLEESELREAIAAARQMQAKVHEAVKQFPPEAKDLRDKLVSAADRTVHNLELALEALLRDTATIQ
jgi:L-lactate utilization protein LutB